MKTLMGATAAAALFLTGAIGFSSAASAGPSSPQAATQIAIPAATVVDYHRHRHFREYRREHHRDHGHHYGWRHREHHRHHDHR